MAVNDSNDKEKRDGEDLSDSQNEKDEALKGSSSPEREESIQDNPSPPSDQLQEEEMNFDGQLDQINALLEGETSSIESEKEDIEEEFDFEKQCDEIKSLLEEESANQEIESEGEEEVDIDDLLKEVEHNAIEEEENKQADSPLPDRDQKREETVVEQNESAADTEVDNSLTEAEEKESKRQEPAPLLKPETEPVSFSEDEKAIVFAREEITEEPILKPVNVEEETEKEEEESEQVDLIELSEEGGEVYDPDAVYTFSEEPELERSKAAKEALERKQRLHKRIMRIGISLFLAFLGFFTLYMGMRIVYTNRQQQESKTVLLGISDTAMALMYHQIYTDDHLSSQTVQKSLPSVVAHPYFSSSPLNESGQLTLRSHQIRTCFSSDRSFFFLFADPLPQLADWFIDPIGFIVDGRSMQMYQVPDYEQWRQFTEELSQQPLFEADFEELLGSRPPLPLSLFNSLNQRELVLPSELGKYYPNHLPSLYYLPRYYLWAKPFIQASLLLQADDIDQKQLKKVRKQFQTLSRFPFVALYVEGGEEKSIELYHALQPHFDFTQLLFGYIELDPQSFSILRAHILSPDQLILSLPTVKNTKRTQTAFEESIKKLQQGSFVLHGKSRQQYDLVFYTVLKTFSSLIEEKEQQLKQIVEEIALVQQKRELPEKQLSEKVGQLKQQWKGKKKEYDEQLTQQIESHFNQYQSQPQARLALLEAIYTLELQQSISEGLKEQFVKILASSFSEQMGWRVEQIQQSNSLKEIVELVKEINAMIESNTQDNEQQRIFLAQHIRQIVLEKLKQYLFSHHIQQEEAFSQVYEQALLDELFYEIEVNEREKRHFFLEEFDQLFTKIRNLISLVSLKNLQRAQHFLSQKISQQNSQLKSVLDTHKSVDRLLEKQMQQYESIRKQINRIPIRFLSAFGVKEQKENHARLGLQILIDQSLLPPSEIRDRQVMESLELLTQATDEDRLMWEQILEGKRMLTERPEIQIYTTFHSQLGFYADDESFVLKMKKRLEKYIDRKRRFTLPMSEEQSTFLKNLQQKDLQQVEASHQTIAVKVEKLKKETKEYLERLQSFAYDYGIAKEQGLFLSDHQYHNLMYQRLLRKIARFEKWKTATENTLNDFLNASEQYRQIAQEESATLNEEGEVLIEQLHDLQAKVNAVSYPYLNKAMIPEHFQEIVEIEIIPIRYKEPT